MNKALPPIIESEAELKAQLRRETHPKRKQRLQALYLLRSGQTRRRVQVATLPSVNRDQTRTHAAAKRCGSCGEHHQ